LKARRGTIEFDGRRIEGARPTAISRLGVTHVPEGRRVFAEHTVEDNLLLGGYPTKKGRASLVTATAAILERFPQLVNRRRDVAGALSGGQQQMLAIAMGLMANPKLLMLDEPSLGLAPIVVYEVYQQISMLRDSGVTVLLVDQLADQALGIADRAAALRLGEIIAVGSGAELLGDAALRAAYLG
jgi:branched-chain amino acid transport system ATP-binding protein